MSIFKTLKELAYFLEYSERTNPNFWFFTCFFAIILNFSPFNPGYSIQSPTTKPCTEKTIAGQTALRICGGDGESRLALGLGKRKNFDIAFHRRLEQHFPDWKDRMDYQKKQEILYKSAMQKRREALRLRLKENFNRTREEQDAIDYFQRTGFYKEQQNPKTKPNIFDTRQSFLMKMHDDKLRDNFLDSFNRMNN